MQKHPTPSLNARAFFCPLSGNCLAISLHYKNYKTYKILEMKQKILAWLQGPRVYLEGVKLYEEYGHNGVLKATFKRSQSDAYHLTLVHELGKLAGLTENELKNLPRYSKQQQVSKSQPETEIVAPARPKSYLDDLLLDLAEQFGVNVDCMFDPDSDLGTTDEQKQTIEAMAPAYAEVPETMKKVIRIREKYPFLKSPECPQELKIMVHDMFTAYDTYREAYSLLSDKNSQDENLSLAATVVESYLENRQMWAELDYYLDKGELLGEHPIFEIIQLRKEISELSDLDLSKKIHNTKSNITKSKNALEKAVTDEDKAKAQKRLDTWLLTKTELEAELVLRKPNA